MGVFLFFLISFVAFFQSTLSGGGAALLLLPILSLLFGAGMIAPIMTIGTSVTGISRLWLFWDGIDWKVVKYYTIPSMIAAFAGSYCLIIVNPKWIQLTIGIFLIASIFQFMDRIKPTKNKHSDTQEPILKPTISLNNFIVVGVFVAFLSGLIGGVGPLINIF